VIVTFGKEGKISIATAETQGRDVDDIGELCRAYESELIALRREFHMHPELGLQEFRTARRITEYLEQLGIDCTACNETGVVGTLRGVSPGPTFMLRADIDALPIVEENDVPYRSRNDGVMHGCGHDAHTAMLLVAAKILAGKKERLSGCVKFVFEPNEENVGSLAMIEEGVLDNPQVDGCMGIHVWAPLAAGKLGVQAGPIMAGMRHFQLEVHGKGGHTATPQSAIDPVLPACSIVQALQSIQTRETDALNEPLVIMVGSINGGTADNIIPETVTLRGTLRTLSQAPDDSGDSPLARFRRVVAGVCSAHGVAFDLQFTHGHPTLVNSLAMVDMVKAGVRDGGVSLAVEPFMTLAGDDFSEFSARVPGVYCFLGAAKPGEAAFPHHHPRFDIDESALQYGVELLVRTPLRFCMDAPQGSLRADGA